MTNPIRFCLVLHNHQPIGNFDHVFEQAYQDSYLPFLDVFEPFTSLRISLHTSGSLMEWLDEHHPEYLDRLAQLVAAGRIEIIGGAVLRADPGDDSVARPRRADRAIHAVARERVWAPTVRGMWMPERVWEQSLTSDLVDAGIKYTILDDFHFNARADRATNCTATT